MAQQNVDLAQALPTLIETAEAYRAAVRKNNADIDDVKNILKANLAAVIAAINNLRGLNLGLPDTLTYRSADDIERLLDGLKITLGEVALSAII